MAQEDLEQILSQLAGKILSAPYGPRTITFNHGLHFTGGEPFLNFELLCKAAEIARELKIPSAFVETNGFWAVDDKTAKEKLKLLRSKGLQGIMVSVNPYYLEYVPFERTECAIRAGIDVFGGNVLVYQLEYFRRFTDLGITGIVPFQDYLRIEGRESLARNVELLLMGRAPYALRDVLDGFYRGREAASYFDEPCVSAFLRGLHNHFDNYGNYVPGFCGGVSFGDCRKLDHLLRGGVDTEQFPVLGLLMDGDLRGLHSLAKERGYDEQREGYISRCHLCVDVRRHLALGSDFAELVPREFYRHLNGQGISRGCISEQSGAPPILPECDEI